MPCRRFWWAEASLVNGAERCNTTEEGCVVHGLKWPYLPHLCGSFGAIGICCGGMNIGIRNNRNQQQIGRSDVIYVPWTSWCVYFFL